MFRIGYNTNGLAHHRLTDALALLAALGYEGVAITPDAGQLDPRDPDRRLVERVRAMSKDLGLDLAVETGSRYLLDPRRKHYPTLLEPEQEMRRARAEFLRRSIDLAAELGARVVSVWAGAAPGGVCADRGDDKSRDCDALWELLCDGMRSVLDRARERGVRVAFEPEPGMFIERPAGFFELVRRLGESGSELGLCLDIGHLLCTGDLPVERVVRETAPSLAQVHLDDIAGGVHEHRMFGEGDLDLGEALRALASAGYRGMAAVELSRDSHRGAWAAAEAMRRIRAAFAQAS